MTMSRGRRGNGGTQTAPPLPAKLESASGDVQLAVEVNDAALTKITSTSRPSTSFGENGRTATPKRERFRVSHIGRDAGQQLATPRLEGDRRPP
jgi:hypothetical protein